MKKTLTVCKQKSNKRDKYLDKIINLLKWLSLKLIDRAFSLVGGG